MSWWDIANDPEESTTRRVLAGIGCGALPWVCMAQEGAESAREEVREGVADLVEDAGGEGGIWDEARQTITTVGEASAAPATAFSNAMMWGSVALGLVLLLVLVGLFVWYVALPYLKGGPGGT